MTARISRTEAVELLRAVVNDYGACMVMGDNWVTQASALIMQYDIRGDERAEKARLERDDA